LKPSAEQQFLYGHHVLKSGLGRITENTPKYQGVVILSMNDMPLVSESKTHSTVNGDMVFCILYHPCTYLSAQKCYEIITTTAKHQWLFLMSSVIIQAWSSHPFGSFE